MRAAVSVRRPAIPPASQAASGGCDMLVALLAPTADRRSYILAAFQLAAFQVLVSGRLCQLT